MIREIKEIKLSQLTEEEIERQYGEAIAKKEQELKDLREKQGGTLYNKEEMALEQEILEIKRVDKEQWVKDRIINSKTLQDLNISFKEGAEILKDNDIPLTLTEEDRVISENGAEIEDMSDLMFVHKTRYFPQDGIIKTAKDAGAYTQQLMGLEIAGQNYKVGANSARETLHFTLNTEVTWNDGAVMGGANWEGMKYTILIPGSEINEEQLVALRGEDTYFKGNIKIPNGGYILVPESEREDLQKRNPELSLVGYEGEPKDYGTALLSNMGYKPENIDANSKRRWENEKDTDKIYEIAKSKGISTLEHCYSQEICEEERGYAIGYISNLFKIVKDKMKENPNFVNEMANEKDLLRGIRKRFIGNVIEGKSDYLNENRCKTEGIEELITKLSEDGFEFSEEQSEFMRNNFTLQQYEKMVEQYENSEIAREVFSNAFVGQISSAIQQSLEKEKSKVDILPSVVEATEEITKSEEVQSKGKELEQVAKEKQMTRENEERGIV